MHSRAIGRRNGSYYKKRCKRKPSRVVTRRLQVRTKRDERGGHAGAPLPTFTSARIDVGFRPRLCKNSDRLNTNPNFKGARFKGKDRLAIVFFDDPVRRAIRSPDLNLLRAQFELTKSEAALAVALLSGLPLKAAAAQSGASFATARTHLVHIFQKTGVHSQPELVNLLRKAGYDG